MIFVALLILLAALYIYFHWDIPIGSHIKIKSSFLTKTPNYLPLLGSALYALEVMPRLHDAVLEIFEAGIKGGLMYLPFSPPYLLFNDPAIIEHVTKTNFENYVKGKIFDDRFRQVFGHGIFNADGEQWKNARKLASNIFSTRLFKSLFETVFKEDLVPLQDHLDEAASTGKVVDVQDLMYRFTLDAFAMIGFGVHLNSLKQKSPFAYAFDRSQAVIMKRFLSPLWWIEEKLFVFSYFRNLTDVATIRNFGKSIVREKFNQKEEEKEKDLLGLFMKYVQDEEELVDHVINFIIAGRDTTALVLSWSIYYLYKNPRVEKKLVQELASLGDQELCYETAKNLEYANAVFKETLRLCPSVPMENKTAVNDDVLPNGVQVPAGTVIVWSNFAMGRNPDIWGDDAKEFKPERWLDDKNPTQYEYPMFHCGPRICLGKSLAQLEGVYVLVNLLRRYQFIVERENVTYMPSLTLPIKDGLPCTIKLRQ